MRTTIYSGNGTTYNHAGHHGSEAINTVLNDRANQRVSRIYPLTDSVYVAQTKKTPVEVKFHPFTSTFVNEPRLEKLYQVTFARENSARSSRMALIFFFMYLVFTGSNLSNLLSKDSSVRSQSFRYFLLVFIPILPIPLLVYISRRRTYEIQFQRIYTLMLLCWSFSIIAGGMFSMLTEWYNYVAKDVDVILDELGIANVDDSRIFYVNSSVRSDWQFKAISGTRAEVLQAYTKEILLPSATMNINLLRLIMIFVFVPLLRIDTLHFALVGVITSASYMALTLIFYPVTDSTPFILNRVLVICFPMMFTLAMLVRNRDVDRVVRQDFLHVWAVELEAEKATREKNLIAEENRTLKQELAQRDSEFNLDLTSPLHALLAELKSFLDTVDLSDEDMQRGMVIVRNLARLDQNLFVPDISAQMKSEKEVDNDTKNWALSVLARKDYADTTRSGVAMSHSSHSNSNSNRRSCRDGLLTGAGGIASSMVIAPLPDMPTWEEQTLVRVKQRIQQDGWDLDTLQIADLTGNRPLMYVTAALFELHELHEEFRVDRVVLRNFLYELDDGYLANPYHNSSHAADVVNSVNFLITTLADGQIRDTLTNLEFYAALVAAAIHDFRHPGKSNNYLIKAKHDLALQYNDRSILESMHLAETFFIMRNPLCDIFGRMKDKPYREIRKAIIEMVLSTDLSMHLQLVGNLKALLLQEATALAAGSSGVGLGGVVPAPKPVTDPMMIMKVVIKCADIGHAAKKRKLHVIWSALIIEEFFLQGDNERANNSDISPFMDRHSENSAKNQVGFFEFIVLPFYDTVAQVIFAPEFGAIHNIAKQNYTLWKEADRRQLSSIVAIKSEVFLNDKVQVPS
ncbi:cAMP-specific 3',5'-cyclic phosphodiesterase, putative [Phytophthora infestans T30-4]|uniref:Phosphodiesterase n=1 Tax=Phytophthora infestans (strain T30-4) TaxID=403677 RepID=D0NJY1_PHYIT|nr:cAMP-specific 3',5'-cyclic phosphodiesterase, putative [Phytophthora infestans T30-4]EEY59818.1 cAMP-specific 3',5'-cyclic phosphodiesterase, putative [Phytophthora infestans T30-4]|eukprot:XP_002900503.1 cAMP-specific 3',5'-cyclic phosphodiesterase, putative [Phytophthora infestans T30-4]